MGFAMSCPQAIKSGKPVRNGLVRLLSQLQAHEQEGLRTLSSR